MDWQMYAWDVEKLFYYYKSNILVQGLVITDWEALERLTDPHDSDYRQSVKLTINAGIDMVGLN